jgi:NADPH:quinone reductase-like Zn-dependent oxidoreductase
VQEVPRPEPGACEALCELLYGAVCSGTDRHLLAGDPPFCHWLQPPFILGHESIGRVVEVGPSVRHLQPGDLVTRVGCPAVEGLNSGWGGFAEYGIATDWQALREDGREPGEWAGATAQQTLPAGTDPAAATLFITWRETLSYSRRLGLGAGDRVLVIGSGGNGLAFASHARNLGAATVALLGAAAREPAARRAGAGVFIDYRDPAAWDAAAAAAPEGYDFAIDAVGKAGPADRALELLAPDGTIAIYGMDEAGQVRLTPTASRGSFTVYRGHYDEAEVHAEVCELHATGRLDASVWLDLENPYPLARIGEAFADAAARRSVKPLIRLQP